MSTKGIQISKLTEHWFPFRFFGFCFFRSAAHVAAKNGNIQMLNYLQDHARYIPSRDAYGRLPQDYLEIPRLKNNSNNATTTPYDQDGELSELIRQVEAFRLQEQPHKNQTNTTDAQSKEKKSRFRIERWSSWFSR